jgi:hypothetical protein
MRVYTVKVSVRTRRLLGFWYANEEARIRNTTESNLPGSLLLKFLEYQYGVEY